MKKHWWNAAIVVSATVGLAACSCSPEPTGGSGGAGGFGGAAAASGGGGFSAVGGASGVGGAGGVSAVGGASGSAGSSCAQGNASASRVTPTVILVVDGSSSMTAAYGNSTRWTAMRDALVGPTGVVTRLEMAVNFGLDLYGTLPMCPLPLGSIPPALNNLGAISNGLPQGPPGLSTPTGEALEQVFARLPDQQAVLDQDLGPQIVILATDGAPNGCADFFTDTSARSLAAAMMGQAKNIPMYVIGITTDAPLIAHLQQMANIGAGMDPNTGTAMLYVPTDPAALSTTLEQIIGGAVGCLVTLNGTVAAGMECSGAVDLSGVQLGCNDPNGWRLAAPNQIEILGTACDEFKTNTASLVHADFPCNVFVPD